MPIRDRADKAASALAELLGDDSDPELESKVREIVEAAMIDAYRDCTERNTKVAKACCEQDMDKAHKIAEEMRRANTALVANLSALR